MRDDARVGSFLFQTSVTTYAAYNTWGGYGFYEGPPSDPTGTTYAASLNRPYLNRSVSIGPVRRFKGAADFLEWELRAVRFLERNGYDVLYSATRSTDWTRLRRPTRAS